jgi:hypothetical protein
MFGESGHCPPDALRCGCLVLWKFAQIVIFHFILYTPFDNTVFLNSKNLKASCSTV